MCESTTFGTRVDVGGGIVEGKFVGFRFAHPTCGLRFLRLRCASFDFAPLRSGRTESMGGDAFAFSSVRFALATPSLSPRDPGGCFFF